MASPARTRPGQEMEPQRPSEELKRQAPSWILSVLLHAGVLFVLSMIPYLAMEISRRSADLPIALAPPAGADLAGVDNPGGASGGNVSQDRPLQPAESYAEAPRPVVPPAAAMDKLLAQLPRPELRAETLVGSSEATETLLKSLAEVSRTADIEGGGGLAALLKGTSKGFGDQIGQLRGTGLDILLVLDATDSMSPYIDQAKKRLHQILDVVTGLVPNARLGVVAYKDYGDDYGANAVKYKPLGAATREVRRFIDDIVAGGGGDIPEPINEALAVATDYRKVHWRSGRKWVIILVGDSPIHASGRKKAFELAGRFSRRAKGTINVIDVGGTGGQGAPRNHIQPDLKKIADEGGGSAFLLTDGRLFWQYLIVSVFGERFKQDVDVIIRKFVRDR